jgi:uncharacterized protein (DUF1697 family)
MSSKKPVRESAACVALLRGINVGGKHIVPMKELAAIFADAGCSEVRTYIQSGNVVFRASASVVEQLPRRVEKKILERFGFPAPVILRTAEQISRTIRHNPFLRAGVPEKALYVYFLADLPSSETVTSLDPKRSAPDVFHVSEREIYLHLPNGAGNSKLTNAYFDSKLCTTCTARNWATILKLSSMMQE